MSDSGHDTVLLKLLFIYRIARHHSVMGFMQQCQYVLPLLVTLGTAGIKGYIHSVCLHLYYALC